ncbi:MAG TPA: beta-galactosidase [Rhizomicrobium sp.]|nr:beta-galactosidase [Rhizomicrobium sp.]
MWNDPIRGGAFARAVIAGASVAVAAIVPPQQAVGQQVSYPGGARSGAALPSEPSWDGIYALSEDLRRNNNLLPPDIYTTDYIDGIVIKAEWSQIEPSPGSYDWTLVDQEVDAAVAHGKKITIGVEAGEATPAWLYAAPYNVPNETFEVGPHSGMRQRGCAPVTLPVPWNNDFEQAYTAMMQALSEHLQTIPGAYSLVTRVKLTGINTVDEEFHLASACGGSDADTHIWRKLGFRPRRVFAAGQILFDAVNTAFPDKLLNLDVIAHGGLPTINNAGQIVTKNSPSYVKVEWDLIKWALRPDSGFNTRFGVQWDAFGTDASRSPRMVPLAGRRGAATGWQLNDWGGRTLGSECGDTEEVAVACDGRNYEKILDGAVRKHGEFLEVWSVNVPQFPIAFRHAQALLARRANPAVGESWTKQSAPAGNSSKSQAIRQIHLN